MTPTSTEREVSGLSQSELWDRPAEARGFSLWQPWASLVALGVKTIETRSWSTKYRGPLMIHAAKRPPEVNQWLGSWNVSQHRNGRAIHQYPPSYGTPGWYLLPLGAYVATCDLIDCVPIIDPDECEWHFEHPRGVGAAAHAAIDGQVIIHTPDRPTHTTVLVEQAFGDYTPGRYAWLLDNIQRIEPIPAKGHQGLWKVDPALTPSAEQPQTTPLQDGSLRPE